MSTPAPSPFSAAMPEHQLAIDSTSLGAFKTCPRLYYYRIICGWTRDDSPHLFFGQVMHEAKERYERTRAAGVPHELALREVVYWGLKATWNKELRRPWISGHAKKNRLSLLRSIVWYLDQWGEAGDPLRTFLLPNGRPAVELSFQVDSGYRSGLTGETILLSGHLDRVVEVSGELYGSDIKTTGGALGPRFFDSFSPNNQMSLYEFCGQIILSRPLAGMIIDGVEVGATYTRFQRQVIPRPRGTLDEWHQELGFWLDWMAQCAEGGRWPMNDKSCDNFGGCQFREVCSRSPRAREPWLKANFVKRFWNPLELRGGE